MWRAPKLIPSARILSCGYNPSVALSQTFAGVDEFAELLLNYLEQQREAGNAKGRPIVFICHSLGGIVVKKVGSSLDVRPKRRLRRPRRSLSLTSDRQRTIRT